MASEDVQKIKDRLSIVDVVGQYVKLKKAGRNYNGLCPFHKERTPSFMVSPERGTYMCFGCGENGDIFSFVEKLEGIDFTAALKQLAEKAGVKLERQYVPNPEHVEKGERLHAVCEEATKFFEKKLSEMPDVKMYLHSRGVEQETISMWRLGYAPAHWSDLCAQLTAQGFTKEEIADAGLAIRSEKKPGEIYDRFRGRIMFPIFDSSGQVIGFSGRFFEKVEGSKEDAEPAKYVNSPETALFKKSRVLYGFDKAKNFMRKLDCILLVEGQFDLILSHQSGLHFTVALSGTALTQEHLSLLGRLSKRLVLALDADQAGVRAGLKSARMALQAGFDVKVPTFPQGKDPADVAKENPELLKAAIRTSKTAVEFFLDVLRQDARDERAYKKLVETNVIPLIAAIESKIDQAHFVSLVAQRLGVPEAAVAAEVAKNPVLSDAPEEVPAASVPQIPQSLEKIVGMLLFHFENDPSVKAKLEELIGKERVEYIVHIFAGEKERLQFEFEALGENEDAVKAELLISLERLLIEEKIKKLHEELRAGMKEEGDLLKNLTTLKRRQEELRK
jgi:DNA primase